MYVEFPDQISLLQLLLLHPALMLGIPCHAFLPYLQPQHLQLGRQKAHIHEEQRLFVHVVQVEKHHIGHAGKVERNLHLDDAL
jgi:hypothetical protein